ncbi:hypothetical protein BDZ85DRAFT_263630 [Elsinoe ampelina]|uniref:Uncharacterized protein n=1 Tax=Elsinoe ampelina TaxID=302913 RepID=A0A6A6G9K5_9PEZI|nr:hypothetical protein BDZ85DRAFT_263630 [Elsinoe ampelina]
MAGCLPDLKRIFNPNKQRPYLPVDPPIARTSISSEHRGRSEFPRPLSRANSTREFGRKGSSRRSSINKGPFQTRQRSTSRSRTRSQSPVRTKSDKAQASTNGESRPTGLFAGVKPPLSDNAALRQNGPAADQRVPRMVSARDLKGLGMERVRHHGPIRAEQMGREQPRVVRFLDTETENTQPWPHPQQPQQPQQVHIKAKKPSKEQLSKHSKPADKAAGLRHTKSVQPLPAQQQQTFLVELPGDFTDVMEKEAVVAAPTIRQVASYDTFELPSRMATPQPQSAVPAHGGQAGLAPVMELPGSTIPPSPNDSFTFTAELPGSAPTLAEKEAGIVAPTELPGSMPYHKAQAELTQRMANATFCAAR